MSPGEEDAGLQAWEEDQDPLDAAEAGDGALSAAVEADAQEASAEEAALLEAAVGVTPQVSGLYARRPGPGDPMQEELRLDVDGRYPQKMASGRIRTPTARIHWVARLSRIGVDSWSGPIVYKRAPDASFPWTSVRISVTRAQSPEQHAARVRLLQPRRGSRLRTLGYSSPSFHPAHFEFDWEEGEAATLEIDTCGHPDRPVTLPCETLTIGEVFERAGFAVTSSPGGPVPHTEAGIDRQWSDPEMHDAMQTYWTRFAAKAQWAIWVFFASLHEPLDGPAEDLGGIMFDDIGPQHRQGCAIFTDSFISIPPPGDPDAAAWVERSVFWTACHEMGHCFNLAHSWDKSADRPWIPLRDEPEARSFMNYPKEVRGGERAFFREFAYRFSTQELRFLRHAPKGYVRPGSAAWFDHHGFQQLEDEPPPAFGLRVRANRAQPLFEFMEPVTLELKLTNVSGEPQLVDERVLSRPDAMTVIVKRDRGPAREVVSYAQPCWKSTRAVLEADRSMYAPLFVSAGRNGWDLADPGSYTVQVALHVAGQTLLSNQLRLRVAPPSQGYEQELLAQEFFSDEVGRIMAFDGSLFFEQGNDTLRKVVERLGDRRVALHAARALGNVVARPYKVLAAQPGAEKRLSIGIDPAKPEEGHGLLASALVERPEVAAESFGHIGYRRSVDGFSELLAAQGETEEAGRAQDALYETMSKRDVQGSKIPERVLSEIDERRRRYRGQ